MNTNFFKEKLLQEKEKLEKELQTVGRINPENPQDWEPTPEVSTDGRDTDLNERADNIGEYENRTAILKQLEIQLLDVNNALKKIEEDKYGICETGGEQISEERLKANPSARTCTEHMSQ